MFAVPALTPQACSIEASARLTSPAPSRQSTGATPGKPADGTLILLAGTQSERTSPRVDSPAELLVLTGIAPGLQGSGSVAMGQDAAVRPNLAASHSGRAPPSLSLL